MPSHRRKLLPLCIAASLLSGLSVEAAAIGVGEIHLQSFLGAPLQAEVPLSHLGDLDANQLKVQLGTRSDYSALGVDYAYLHSQLKIEPIIKNGEGYVRISTREPIAEPYLNFVLSLRWPQGQLVREFTVLLDPPNQPVAAISSPASAVKVQLATASEPAVAVPAPAMPHRRHHRQASSDRLMPAASTPITAPSAGSYLIQRGDSLWRIANRVRPALVPVEQVMAAIQALNPQAFINGNPNLLKEAATIALPDAAQIAAAGSTSPAAGAMPAAGATAQVAASKVAESKVPESKVPESEMGSRETPDSSSSAEQAPAVAQLVEENSSLKSQVADLTSNVATLNQNLVQSEQRLHQLESQLNQVIEQMQQQRATMASLSGADMQHGAAIAQSTGSVINQVNAGELRNAPKAHTPWWVHLLYWLGIGGAVTWAVREHFWPQRRFAPVTIVGGDGALMGGDVASAPLSTTASRSVASEPRSRSVDLSRAAPELPLDLDEPPAPAAPVVTEEPAPQLLRPRDEPVDASISAGVFVAFGRFAEAERLLRDALIREPARTDLKLQLLDVLMQSDQPGAFDDLATEIESEAGTPETLAELAVLRDSYRPRH